MKKIAIIFTLLMTTNCVTLLDEAGNPGFISPRPLFLKNIPTAEDNYSQGFRDGCYNFIGQNGFGYNRFYDRPPIADEEILLNPLYQQGYRNGDKYCGIYVNKGIIL